MTTEKPTTHTFNAEVSKVLQLVIHSLYTNKDIFLRELISNASDACDKLRYQAISAPELLKDDPELSIRLSFDKAARTLTIFDNGIGMSKDELVTNLGTIAKSGTEEFAKQLTGDSQKDAALIGQFGVGFYASFMVADRVVVHSIAAGSDECYVWESAGAGEFTVTRGDCEFVRGTSITLHIKEEFNDYLDKFRLQHIAQTYSDHISIPIIVVDEEGKEDTVNKASALWTRPKSEITEEQYREFYHHVAHAPDDPWMVLHNKAEGMIEYTNLLFIPSIKPFDLFHPDRKRRVKLYVKRVFITDEQIELVPHYMRFLRGIIDSQDLPLNVSRETLQANPVLVKIRNAVVKKVLGELKKKAADAPESYAEFWLNFGAVLKEGLCEHDTPKESLLEICRFYSTHNPNEVTGLDAYIERMKEGQKEIYYLTGDKLESLQKHPQLGGFTSRGIEVLLLTDHVDDFWVNVVSNYKDTPFKSITRSDIDLSAFDATPAEDDADKPKEAEAHKQAAEALAKRFQTILAERVKEVRLTTKLTDTPVCLAVEEGAMDIRLERFLIEQKQLPSGMPKILELNPTHPIICRLSTMLEGEDDLLADYAWLLFDQARIIEGEEVSDAAEFSKRMNGLIQKVL